MIVSMGDSQTQGIALRGPENKMLFMVASRKKGLEFTTPPLCTLDKTVGHYFVFVITTSSQRILFSELC